jgi:DNA-binding SARP family transcriptional activator
MARERLAGLLEPAWSHRLTLVVGPAGCGKTTLLTQFATACSVPVLWYRAECSDGDAGALLAHLEAAARVALPIADAPWRSLGDAAHSLEGAVSDRLLLVLDDLHTLHGTDAERAIEQLLHYLPDAIAVLAGSRRPPAINLSRLRVAGMLMELGPDALRFRLWEVERLFREYYADPLSPEELAELARRTDGWPAVLHLFHLATRGCTRVERRRRIAVLGTRNPLVREYLVHNVLADLSTEAREFLLRSALLGRMSGAVCDALLDRQGSDRVLADLERLQLVSPQGEDDGWYRCHEVLRSHLATVLEEEEGEAWVREERRRAGSVLESAGADGDALAAYCAAEDWTAAGRLLGLRREAVVSDPGWWVDHLPDAILDEDPWVMLAAARRHRSAGRARTAVALYRRAEAAFGTASPSDTCRRERAGLTAWIDPHPAPAGGVPELLRAATLTGHRTPRGERGGPEAELIAGVAALLAGECAIATERLGAVLGGVEGSRGLHACVRLGHAIAAALSGDAAAATLLDTATEAAEREGFGWLAGLARAATAPLREAPLEARQGSGEDEDAGWGDGLRALLRGWAEAGRGEGDAEDLERARRRFDALQAPVLACWAGALEVLVRARRRPHGARAAAIRIERAARRLGVPGARCLALLALAELGEGGHREVATALARSCGLALPEAPPVPAPDRAADSAGPPVAPRCRVRISCLGGLVVSVGGRPVDLATLRPKVRSLLRILALHRGRAVHREVLVEALWPEADADTGTRNLQVAISSLRQVLDRGWRAQSVVREGGAYRLWVGPDDSVDLLAFEAAQAAAGAAHGRGDADAVRSACLQMLALYQGELLPEEGPAEWVVADREHRRTAAADAALMLAAVHADWHEWPDATRACERALSIDRDCDRAWRLLISLHERAGGVAEAARARRRYALLLAEVEVQS